MRCAPSRAITASPRSSALIEAATTPLVLIVTSSLAMTTFSTQGPLTTSTSGETVALSMSAWVIVWPTILQLTLTFASAAMTDNTQHAKTTKTECKRARDKTRDDARVMN